MISLSDATALVHRAEAEYQNLLGLLNGAVGALGARALPDPNSCACALEDLEKRIISLRRKLDDSRSAANRLSISARNLGYDLPGESECSKS
jgi:hypothetical protein